MIYKYEIRNINGEDVLYLYLTMSYEFSKELKNTSSDTDLTRRTKNFIKSNNGTGRTWTFPYRYEKYG